MWGGGRSIQWRHMLTHLLIAWVNYLAITLMQICILIVTSRPVKSSYLFSFLFLNQGRQEALGTLNELQAHGIDFAKLLKEYDDEEDEADDDGLITSRPGSIRSRAGSKKSRAGSLKKEVSHTNVENTVPALKWIMDRLEPRNLKGEPVFLFDHCVTLWACRLFWLSCMEDEELLYLQILRKHSVRSAQINLNVCVI